MKTVTVPIDLGDRSYEIHIGDALMDQCGVFLSPHMSQSRIAIISDENVFAAQGERFCAGFDKEVRIEKIILPPGESTKSISSLEKVLEALLDLKFERNDLVVALGGGVIGDIAGFAASLMKRGCKVAQVPTSLLAQVDSSVGGKTGINTRHGKNLIGSFYQPSIVLCDLPALETLSPREVKSGYAEIVKYAAIDDAPFFEWLEQNGTSLLAGDRTLRQYAVAKSCTKKAAIVAADEREQGQRALLNLGHTFGHALEVLIGYDGGLNHGEAVALGMALAFDYSVHQGLCNQDDATRLKAHLSAVGHISALGALSSARDLSADQLLIAMMQDKKNQAGKLTLILAHAIGNSFVAKDIPLQTVRDFLLTAGAK